MNCMAAARSSMYVCGIDIQYSIHSSTYTRSTHHMGAKSLIRKNVQENESKFLYNFKSKRLLLEVSYEKLILNVPNFVLFWLSVQMVAQTCRWKFDHHASESLEICFECIALVVVYYVLMVFVCSTEALWAFRNTTNIDKRHHTHTATNTYRVLIFSAWNL